MKTAIFFLTIFGIAFALPTAIDWDNVHPSDVFMESINDISYPATRVIGGTEAARNSIPYQVALIINGGSFCGGSAISRQYVLTAAHCTIRASNVQLIYGAHNVRQTEATQVIVTSTNVINHAQYNSNNLNNDIALVRSPSQVTLNSNIQTIALASASAGNYAGSSALLTGWGRVSDSSNSISPVLRRATVPVITNAVCSQTYGSSVILSSTICTSGAGTVGGCNGDSGGPLVVGSTQVGVVSFVSARGCESGLPTGYVRVSSFRSWISTNSGV